ncbi:hypothetical protein [Levilinea saccharolytica]|nr:hypothetical protein [Levilinea saccharolytica]
MMNASAAPLPPLQLAAYVAPGLLERQGIFLAASLRAFGQHLAGLPLRFYCPCPPADFAPQALRIFQDCGVTLCPLSIPTALLEFPYAAKVFAAAQAEADVLQAADPPTLVWLDPDTFFQKAPLAFALPPSAALAYRPVMHNVIGPLYGQPLDAFWETIFSACGVPHQRLFPMQTVIDQVQLYPYFNDGLLVLRPQLGLLHAWLQEFTRLYQHPDLLPLYAHKRLYAIFVHQAVLAGVLLARLAPEQMLLLPPDHNYPLNLYARDQTPNRPARLEPLTTFRFEDVFENPAWEEGFPAGAELRAWIRQWIFWH